MRHLLCFFVIILIIKITNQSEEDLYELLGIARDATVTEIRKAFKALAVKMHPDKNQDDKDADAKFVKIARAYEILKDPDKRKRYDLYGEEDADNQKKHFHSYTYYKEQFGIYDDDPLIVTLSRNDYEVNVLDDAQPWFVNFYSPYCLHCHELAPTWRKLAEELEGVVRLAAVNCEEDYPLCYSLSIESYPTLLYYEQESHMYDGEKYRGPRNFNNLKTYVLSKIKDNVKEISPDSWNSLKNESWLLFLCADDNLNCPSQETQKKLAAALDGLMPVGIVTDVKTCNKISEKYKIEPIVFWHVNKEETKSHTIEGSDSKEILDKVLTILPNPVTLDEDKFVEIRTKLRRGTEKPWLICFYMGTTNELNLQLKRLPTLISSGINIGLIHCGRSSQLCGALHVARYPTWGLLKDGGAFEVHHGRDVLHEVAAFARDGAKSTNFHALSPADFLSLKKAGEPWLVGWYAPWCPPCRKLLPEVRKASLRFRSGQVQFGAIDCALHRDLCSNEGISSYPSLVIYNGTGFTRFHGTLNEESISEFIDEMLNPVVINLDESSFISLIRKPKDELWVVDFFAPWCGPCQRLAPEWRRLAKSVSQFKEIKIAHVDCVSNDALCNAQNVRSYPTIRLYPLGSKGLSTVAIYNGNRDMVSMKRWLLSFLPSNVELMDPNTFKTQVLKKQSSKPWLIDFYAPWCGHCIHFEPEFRSVATRLAGIAKCAKIDCEAHRFFCGEQRITAYPTIRLYLSPNVFYTIDNADGEQMIKLVKQYVSDYEATLEHDEL